jgi:hypothetical protein
MEGAEEVTMKKLVTALLVLTLLVVPASAVERREIQFPAPPGYQTLVCDFHMHTVFSDGYVWPTVRVDEAWREGLDVMAITDHVEYQPRKDDIPTNHNRPYELTLEKAKRHNLLLIQGAEITRDTPPGHFNAIFLDDVNPLDTPDFFDVFDRAAEQHAFVFWNHPGWQGRDRGRWGEKQQTLFDKQQLHGIEICNGDQYYEDAHRWAMEKNLTLIGSSDIHQPSQWSQWTSEEHRTVTLVFARDRTLEAVREALVARRTAVWQKNQLLGRKEHLAALFPACMHVEPPHHRSEDSLWLEIENRCELDIELTGVGKTRPATIRLPARSTTVVRLHAPSESENQVLNYMVENFLIGPYEPLKVVLKIPAMEH